MEQKVVIIGAGPAGLGAAYRLQELGYRNFKIFERNSYIGGLAASFKDNMGFTYDIGGHVIFSHYKYFDELIHKLLGDNYTEITREAWIWMLEHYVPYPFQYNFGYLPPEIALECIMGLIDAQRKQKALLQAENFDDLIDAQFGLGIGKYFMKPYNYKVWAHPIHWMSIDWLGDRVAVPSIERVLRNLLFDVADKEWGSNDKFKYPLHGGTGGLYSPLVQHIGDHLYLEKDVVAIDKDIKQVRFDDGEIVEYDLLLSTMPLDLLIRRLNGIPKEIKAAIRGLHHVSGLIVGIGVEQLAKSEKCWIYYPEDSIPFYRLTYLSNYSPFITPDPERYTLLLCETSYSQYKPETKHDIVDRVVQGLIRAQILEMEQLDKIVTDYVIDIDYSYPIPTLDRNQALAIIQPYLMRNGIFSRGRFGAWEYEVGNMDHSVMQGVELVNHWLLGEPEITWKDFGKVA